MDTQAKPPPKGILKKTNPIAETTSAELDAATKARNLAIHHASIIHDRRKISDTISDAVIALSKLPSGASATPPPSAASPSDDDAVSFTSQIRLFQPSDYDELIEERNCLGKCGYVLCPKPRIKVNQTGEFKLVNFGRKDFAIVPKKEMERWCSQACARRAMYIKVQLNETAAWERAGIEGIQIELYQEASSSGNRGKTSDPAGEIAKDLRSLKLEADRKAASDARELALERGDTGEKAQKRRVAVKVKEKDVSNAPAEPSLDQNNDGHLLLEGYKPKFDAQQQKDHVG
ncbi:Rtr1/RPAP2 family protein [Apiospora kogelbergensis]|uniref:RNA polymerase II subunit B1 CTD phosphatase RPAP2 homolog n=1 Tax=Apiospora kogelbergensis TaxID=1337665 RepID=A0AAW0QV23_9PEZI